MTTPKTSAIVVTYRTGPRLRDCLYALKSDPEVDEVIIVDNGNPEPISSWLSEDVAGWDKTSALLRSGKNLGFGAACNKG
ncbi:MAG: glycosyltransferase, partial [Pseudomonadota bacterium]